MTLEIVREPYLGELRKEVAALKQIVDGKPNQLTVARAWVSLDKIKEALGELCPNHPQVLQRP